MAEILADTDLLGAFEQGRDEIANKRYTPGAVNTAVR